MNTYICTGYPSHWLGGYAVIVAESPEHAAQLLTEARGPHASIRGIPIDPNDMELLDTTTPAAHILFNGDY